MRITDVAQKTGARILVGNPDADIKYAYTGDLLSDVMGHCSDESILITIQNHLNTVAVCTLVGVEAVLICHDRPVPDDMLAAASREEIAILQTPMSQFEASIALSSLGPSRK